MHSDPLKLIALDRDDLEVISAHLQDAVTKVGEILWRPAEHRVVIALNRFDWEAAQEAVPAFQRRRTALRFDRVMSCKCRDLDCSAKERTPTMRPNSGCRCARLTSRRCFPSSSARR